jgi:hypothetical protein
MRNSSVQSDRYGFGSPESLQKTGVDPGTGVVGALKVPEFGNYVQATTARRAGRINAASISESEHKALLAERQRLLDKKFAETIERRELNRLAYVNWTLDRVEDARNGEHLDRLEGVVVRYEMFKRDLEDLVSQLKEASSQR